MESKLPTLHPADIAAWRNTHRLTLTEAGRILGVDRQSVFAWEHGRSRFPFYLAFALAFLDEHQEELQS
jgi:DNA-binding transcriptional regulator YiaG